MLRIYKILHPTDFSASAMRALELARSLARDHGATLILVTAVSPMVAMSEVVPPVEDIGSQFDEANKDLKELADTITDVPVQYQAVFGMPGKVIKDAIDSTHADLVVMGNHGRSGLSRLLMGSVAEYVVRYAHCPVLTVKASDLLGHHVEESSHEALEVGTSAT
jgi:universal stress protein A